MAQRPVLKSGTAQAKIVPLATPVSAGAAEPDVAGDNV
jgi:hypothetical protein